jgi:hypothetical protein
MTPSEWAGCEDPDAMLDFLRVRGKLTERKSRLFAVACCRRIWALIPSRVYQDIVDVAERFADGQADWQELRAAEYLAYDEAGIQGEDSALWAASHTAGDCVYFHPYYHFEDTTHFHAAIAAGPAAKESIAQASLLRDIFGNPFRPLPSLGPAQIAWNEGCVVKLATSIYEERDFSVERIGVLADALEEAGVTDEEVLGHLHGPGPHVRGCHVLDLLLARQ